MKIIEVTDFEIAEIDRFTASKYPGTGAYQDKQGNLIFVVGESVTWLMPEVGRALVTERGTGFQFPGAGIDIHRLLNQLIEFKRC